MGMKVETQETTDLAKSPEEKIANELSAAFSHRKEIISEAAENGYSTDLENRLEANDKAIEDLTRANKELAATSASEKIALESIAGIREHTDPTKMAAAEEETAEKFSVIFKKAIETSGTIRLLPPKVETESSQTKFKTHTKDVGNNTFEIQSEIELPVPFGVSPLAAIQEAQKKFTTSTATPNAGQYYTADLFPTIFTWGAGVNPLLDPSVCRVLMSEDINDLKLEFIGDWSTTTNRAESTTTDIPETDPTLQGGTLSSKRVPKLGTISDKFWRLAPPELMNIMAEEMSNNIAEHLNTQLTTGDGTGQNVSGLITEVRKNANNIGTAITYSASDIVEKVIGEQYNMESRVFGTSSYMANLAAWGKVRTANTTNIFAGQPVANQLRPSEDRQVPLYIDNAVPCYSNPAMHSNIETAGNTFLVGDFRYWVSRVGAIEIQFLKEYFAAKDQRGLKVGAYVAGALISSGKTSGASFPIRSIATAV